MESNELALVSIISLLILLAGCIDGGSSGEYPDIERESKIPADSEKVTPETDVHPPLLHSDEYQDPVPVSDVINTAGGEDSPYILPRGKTFYFFFTPDVSVPAEEQINDDVTGIYVTKKVGSKWSEPERVWLQDPGRLSLDGAPTVAGDRMYFASAREGYTGMHIFTAEKVDGEWANWEHGGERFDEMDVGELHVVGAHLYFHSGRSGGKGEYDIWMTAREGDSWGEPMNIEAVNSAENDGWPYVTPDEKELWFTRQHSGSPSIWRSKKVNGTWGEPEMILSRFAAEPTLDEEGNIYFAHHYFRDDRMIEADIYVCHRT